MSEHDLPDQTAAGALRLPAVEPLPERCDLRLPSPDDDGLAGRLARANERRRQAAADRLRSRLAGIDAVAWAAQPGPGQPTAGGLVGLLDDWDRAAGTVRTDNLRGREVDLLVGQEVGPHPVRSLGAALDAVAAGATLRVGGVGDLLPGVADLADDLSAVLTARVGVSLSITAPGAPFASTWHDHDLLLIGLDGSLEVQLTGPIDEAPLREVSPDPTGPPAWRGALGPSDVLVVPRGWALAVLGPGRAAWAEVTVRRQRGVDLAVAVAARAGGARPYRDDILDPALGPDGDPWADLPVSAWTASAVAEWAARLRPSAQPTLRDLWSEPCVGAVRLPGGVALVDGTPHDVAPTPDGVVALAAADRLLRVDVDAAEGLVEDDGGSLRDVLALDGLVMPRR